jgi:hypothetical protein
MTNKREGNMTLIEVPLSSTRWFITVYAETDSRYSLSVINKPEGYPRIGSGGILNWAQIHEDAFTLSWSRAVASEYTVNRYLIYRSISLQENPYVQSPLVLNTVCGLRDNTDYAYAVIDPASACTSDICTTNITGILPNKTYVLNVVAESSIGLTAAYSGVVARSKWDKSVSENFDDMSTIACITGASLIVTCLSIYWTLDWRYS